MELEVAKVLTKRGVNFEYERILNCDNKFYFPDFTLGEVAIECTFWSDVEQKASQLKQKINQYLKFGFKLVLIVTSPKYVKEYSLLLGKPNVRVITSDNLSELLDGK